jgi:CRP/FNR family cyclic AMP-dependent transcriptional regulator
MKSHQHSYKRDVLKQVPLFSNLNKRSLDDIGKIADKVEVSAGKVLAKEGTLGLEFAFILEGEARVEKGGKVINRLSANDFYGEIAIIDRKPRTATVIAETDMKLLVVHSRFFRPLLEKTPDLANQLVIALCKYIREAESQRV